MILRATYFLLIKGIILFGIVSRMFHYILLNRKFQNCRTQINFNCLFKGVVPVKLCCFSFIRPPDCQSALQLILWKCEQNIDRVLLKLEYCQYNIQLEDSLDIDSINLFIVKRNLFYYKTPLNGILYLLYTLG